MKQSIYNLGEITRGMSVPPTERNPKDMEDKTEMFIVGYKDLLSYNEVPSLLDTINKNSLEEKVFVNLNQKYKQGTIRKKDIILPISNMDYEPKFVNWTSDEPVNFIYHHKLIVIRPNIELVVPEYLFFKLNSKEVRNYWFENSIEGSKHRLICKTVQDFKIDIPNKDKQLEIVERLKKLDMERQEIFEYINKNDID